MKWQSLAGHHDALPLVWPLLEYLIKACAIPGKDHVSPVNAIARSKISTYIPPATCKSCQKRSRPLSATIFRLFFRAFFVQPPDDNARNQYEHEHQRTYPHNHLAPEYSAVRLHVVQQPAVQAKHGEEERRTLIPAFYLTGILVYINGCTPRFRQTDPTGTFRIGRDGDACNSNTVRQCFERLSLSGIPTGSGAPLTFST